MGEPKQETVKPPRVKDLKGAKMLKFCSRAVDPGDHGGNTA